MTYGLLLAVLLLAFANGANDNFKGVATLWGTRRYPYGTVLLWATAATFAGSLLAGLLAGGLAQVFSGSAFLGSTFSPGPVFLLAVAVGTAATVLLATRLGFPVSTTHALVGSLVGAGVLAVGAAEVNWTLVGSTLALPLLFAPLLAMGLTVVAYPPLARWLRRRSCVCVTQPAAVVLHSGATAVASPSSFPALRITHRANCEKGDELTRWNAEELLHWASAGLISFSRGLNDAPKIAALALAAGAVSTASSYMLVASAMALGGLVGAQRVARTMSHRVTRIEPATGMTANLVAGALAAVASPLGLPVSTTHVTMGGIFGVGAHRRKQTNWSLVRQIALAWGVTLPLGLAAGIGFYYALKSLS